jgi:hypothetical protein
MSDFTDYPERLDLREQLARIDGIMASNQKMLRERANVAADTWQERLEPDTLAAKQRDDREQLARIDNLLANAQKKRLEHQNLMAETGGKRIELELQTWQVFATLLGGGAAFFAAGAAFVKLIGG